ncbi:hypothetical protein B9Z55_022210 [Caenorhabditis nigoni]|uniref:Uncharacterized protein n=1 Tax=Caenorhabditis nigoni TaxID=1611254 RepID=A0A2G5SJ10_9PELO|nr:hypothetical protein B9Z55_022210 [Caenorhabditis nigoni]
MRPRTPYTKEPLQYKRRPQKPIPAIHHSPFRIHSEDIFYGQPEANPVLPPLPHIFSHLKSLLRKVYKTKLKRSDYSKFLFLSDITYKIWYRLFSIVPLLLFDSKKVSYSKRCWTNDLYRSFIHSIFIIHLFMLFNQASSTSYITKQMSPLCKTFGFFTQHNDTVTDRCSVWSDDIIPEICSAGTQSRIRILKHVFLFPELQPLSLFEMFSVGLRNTDMWQLNYGEKGSDCISGSINRCTSCFRRVSGTLRKLNEAYRSFDTTLSRFDCLPAVDTASATRPFSPNATCDNCKIWYRRWLLVQSLQIWQRPSCINWCYYTQLACPHLAPAKLWDYAGHPSFQCRDMDIDSWRHECDCIHPCDVRGIVGSGVAMGNAPSVQHDFFAAQIHCETRKKECHKRFKQIRKLKRSESLDSKSSNVFIGPVLFLLLFLRFMLLL